MIIDLDELEDRQTWCRDICIIGSGAAGIAIAREFVGSDVSVLMLEGGGGAHLNKRARNLIEVR